MYATCASRIAVNSSGMPGRVSTTTSRADVGRIVERVLKGDRSAHAEADDRGATQRQFGDDCMHVSGHVCSGPIGRPPARLATAATDVGCDHPAAVGQPTDLARPVSPVAAKPVNQHHRFGDRIVKAFAVEVEIDEMDKGAAGVSTKGIYSLASFRAVPKGTVYPDSTIWNTG